MGRQSPTEGVGGSYKVIDKRKYFAKVGHEPHVKQWLFHNSAARFRLPCCGRRFGKSRMAGMDAQPKLLVPDSRVWIVGPTYDLAEKEFRVIWDTMIVKMKFGQDRRVKRAYNKKQGVMYITFPWGAHLECRSADHPENLVGDSLDHVIVSEAAKHKQDTFERYLRAALADRHGTADFPTTPEGQNWFYKMWKNGQNPDDKEHASWRFPSWMNPYVFPLGREDPEIKLVERTASKTWFDQEYGADFTSFVGKIYGSFQEGIHTKPHTFRPDWENYIAFDWGYTNPMAAVEFQVSPDDKVYIWRVWYKSHMMIEEFLNMIRQTPNPEGYHLDLCFGDAADPEKTARVSTKFHPCISDPRAKHGTVDAKGKAVAQSGWQEGVDLVNSFLAIRPGSDALDLTDAITEDDLKFADSQGGPSLYVDPRCTDVIREFNNYRSPDNGRNDKNVREAANPFEDHTLDAIRYGLMHRFKLGFNMHLADVYTEPIGETPDTFTSMPEVGYFNLASLDRAF